MNHEQRGGYWRAVRVGGVETGNGAAFQGHGNRDKRPEMIPFVRRKRPHTLD